MIGLSDSNDYINDIDGDGIIEEVYSNCFVKFLLSVTLFCSRVGKALDQFSSSPVVMEIVWETVAHLMVT